MSKGSLAYHLKKLVDAYLIDITINKDKKRSYIVSEKGVQILEEFGLTKTKLTRVVNKKARARGISLEGITT